MNFRSRLRSFVPIMIATMLFAAPLTTATATASPSPEAGKPAVSVAAASWHWVGWYPDPVLCAFFGATTGRPFECRYTFPWSWDLYVWA